MTKLTTLEGIFLDLDFRDSVSQLALEIKEYAKSANNERSIEAQLDMRLYALFDKFLKQLGYQYNPEKEKTISCFRSDAVDSALTNVLLEFKHPSTLSSPKAKETALKQILSYLEGENQQQISKTFAMVTDGISCAIFTVDFTGKICYESFTELTLEHYIRLIKAIVGLQQKTFDSEALVADFAPHHDSPIRNLTLLLYRTLTTSETPKTQMLLQEWKNLFKLSHDDHSQQKDILQRKQALSDNLSLDLHSVDSEYNALFALQTSYSILLKLIAFKVVSQVKFNNSLIDYSVMLNADVKALQSKMEDLESGSIIRDYGIQNLLEGDFFSWYVAKAQWNLEIAASIKVIIAKLNKYTTFDFFDTSIQAKDFFKNLYQTIIPSKVRHALGEYYTPSWLANHLVSKALSFRNQGFTKQSTNSKVNTSQNWRGLDPTCGSGTFLISLINQVLSSLPAESSKSQILAEITSRVVGIDLNPLAVLTARVNYFLNISPYLEFDSEVEIPIYPGDAAYTPEVILLEGVSFLKYSLDTDLPNHRREDMTFPVYFPEVGLRDLKRFSRCMLELELDIRSLNVETVYNRLMTLIPEQYQDLPIIKEKLRNLAEHFIRFERNNWNGIWARIITNYLITSKLGDFEIIVGNPPWVDWKNLPSQYREKIKSLQITKTIFSGDGRTGGINLNIAALITNVVASNWLSKEGVMALLLPNTFLVQKTYEGFRNLQLANNEHAYFIAFDDWTKAGNPFENVTQKFYTYYFAKQPQDYRAGLVIESYIKHENLKGKSFNSSQEELDLAQTFKVEKGLAVQSSEQTTNFSILPRETGTEVKASRTTCQKCNTRGKGLTIDTAQLISAQMSDYKGREGVEIYPLELMLYQYIATGVQSDTAVTLQNGQFKKAKFKVPPLSVFVEKQYLRPLVRGVDITPFHVESNYLVPFAYEAEVSKRVAIDETLLRKTSPNLYKHFLKYKDLFTAQNAYSKKIINGKNVPFYAMARVGDYTFAPHHVAFRDNSKNVAAVVSTLLTPWVEAKAPLFQNHAVTISQRPDGSFISLEEAYYIAGIINSDLVCEFVEVSSDSRSFPIRPRYQIPLFGNQLVAKEQAKIVKLSQQAHQCYQDLDKISLIKAQIGKIYLLMLTKLAEQN